MIVLLWSVPMTGSVSTAHEMAFPLDPTNEGGTAYEFTPLLTWYVRGGFFVSFYLETIGLLLTKDSMTDLWRALRRDS